MIQEAAKRLESNGELNLYLLDIFQGPHFYWENIAHIIHFFIRCIWHRSGIRASSRSPEHQRWKQKERRGKCYSLYTSAGTVFASYVTINHANVLQVSIIENVYWKELGLLVFVWIVFLALQISKVNFFFALSSSTYT